MVHASLKSSLVLSILNQIGNVAIKHFAEFVENIAVIADNFVFIVAVNYMKSETCSFCKLITGNTFAVNEFVNC
jgi:hypothetical protein